MLFPISRPPGITAGVPGNDAYTTVLLHMDGSDASTTFTDDNSGGSSKTWTAVGSAQIDTAESKFGGASYLSDGNQDYIYTADHADLQFGSGDFTIDGWFRRTGGFGTLDYFFGQANSAGNSSTQSCILAFNTSNQLEFSWFNGAPGTLLQSTTTFASDDGWHHFAVVRNGDDWRLYIDGTSEASTTSSGSIRHSAGTQWGVGNIGIYAGASTQFTGWIDEFRVSKGIARWTTGFTPPAGPYI